MKTVQCSASVFCMTALSAALAACDGSASRPSGVTTAASTAPSTAQKASILPGHVVAQIDTPQGRSEADALLMPDGTFRLYVHGVGREVLDPTGSVQLVGHLAASGSHATGAGTVIGMGCGLPEPNRFCAALATWQLTLDTVSSWIDHGAEGDLVITSSSGEERWFVDTGYWGGQAHFQYGWSIKGLYRELLAEFGQDGDVVIDVSSDGRFFFQGAHSGCVGNGLLTPYVVPRGSNIFAVELTIERCRGSSIHLNRRFEGLSVIESATPWDYWGAYHKMWLSTPPDGSSPAALMLVAELVE